MDAEFIEKYGRLSEMRSGDMAISKDRSQVFVCGTWSPDKDKGNQLVVLDLKRLSYQYSYDRDMTQLVKILQRGDQIVITV